MTTYDAVICGAGVGGLALSIGLGKQGYRVLVVDKQRKEIPIHKGEFLQPRSLHIFQEWGVLDNLIARGAIRVEMLECRGRRGESLGELDYQVLPEPFNYGMVHYYQEIKEALLDVATHLADIRYGSRVVELLYSASGRVRGVCLDSENGHEEITAPFIVGADGRMSGIRKIVEKPIRMYEYPHQLCALDLRQVYHLETHILNFLSPEGIRVLYPMPGARARLYVQIPSGSYRSIKMQGMAQWKEELLTSTPGLSLIADNFPPDFQGVQVLGAWHYCIPFWTRPGIVFIGDAAHGVHPMAGQGMNAAIADAWMLAHVLVEATAQAKVSEQIIDQTLVSYEQQRRKEFSHVAGLSHRMSLLYTTTSPLFRAIAYRTVFSNRTNRRLQRMVTYNMSGLGACSFTWRDRLEQFGLLSRRYTASQQT